MLTAREVEVLTLIARGYTYREAATELFVSTRTIETHVSAVLRKLQLSNRRELARWAHARDLQLTGRHPCLSPDSGCTTRGTRTPTTPVVT